MQKVLFCITVFTLGIFARANGQSFGGNKWAQEWQQYNGEDVKVIFPVGYEKQAARVFSIIGYLHDNHRNSIGVQTDKISIVLNNLNNISNGYVGLGPFRSEFFSTPPQNNFALGSLPWMDLLSVHEYRHVLQFSNGRVGISKILSILFGQFAYAGAINVAVPDWYFEGDAVMAETAMTPQGRGRIPQFLQAYKAYEKAGTRFSYEKVRNGSYKHFIPDHYRLGYMMNKYGADNYGETFWGEVLRDAGAFKGLFYPFSNAIKKRSGHSTASLYQATFDHYRSTWSKADKSNTSSNPVFESNDRVFTNYRLPQYHNGELYYLKGSLSDISQVWKYDGAKHTKLFAYGLSNDRYMDISGGQIAWSELRFHPSRGNINYSVVMLYDLETGVKKQIGNATRYTSPTHHPTENIVAVVETDEYGETLLKIITDRDALVVDSLPNPNGYFITYPKWNADGSSIYFSARNAIGQMAICKQDVNTGNVNALSSWSYRPIGVPHISGEVVYFSRSDDTAEHIYRVSSDGSEEQIVESEFGAYQPTIHNNSIVYSSYTADGYRIAESEINPKVSSSSGLKTNTDSSYISYGGNILPEIKPTSAESKKYGRFSYPLNLHSWGVTADDQTASLLIESDNILNSVSLSGGLQYIFNDDRAIWTAAARIGLTYPNITARYTLESRSFFDEEENEDINFDDQTIELGLEFPMNLSSGAYLRSLLPRYAIKRNSFDIKNREDKYGDFSFNSHEFGMIFLNRRLKAPRDILATYSQYFNVNYQGSLSDIEGSQFDIEAEVTFPGFLKSHVFRFELDYNTQSENLFGNRFDGARGYSSLRGENNFRVGVNYHLPLVYPDFGIGGIIYLKRIQANVFYDYSSISTTQTIDLSSTGVEVLFDTQVMNTLPVTLGMRYAYQINTGGNAVEFFVPFYRF